MLHAKIELPERGTPGSCHLRSSRLARGRSRPCKLRRLCERIESHVPHGEPLVIAGDFNDWRSRATARSQEHARTARGFSSSCMAPTRGHFRAGYPRSDWIASIFGDMEARKARASGRTALERALGPRRSFSGAGAETLVQSRDLHSSPRKFSRDDFVAGIDFEVGRALDVNVTNTSAGVTRIRASNCADNRCTRPACAASARKRTSCCRREPAVCRRAGPRPGRGFRRPGLPRSGLWLGNAPWSRNR